MPLDTHLVGISTETLRQFAGKVPGYEQFLTRGDWRHVWPDLLRPTVRVFVLTPSAERVRTLVTAIRELPAADAFRFGIFPTLTPENFFAEAVWQTCQGDRRAVLKATAEVAA